MYIYIWIQYLLYEHKHINSPVIWIADMSPHPVSITDLSFLLVSAFSDNKSVIAFVIFSTEHVSWHNNTTTNKFDSFNSFLASRLGLGLGGHSFRSFRFTFFDQVFVVKSTLFITYVIGVCVIITHACVTWIIISVTFIIDWCSTAKYVSVFHDCVQNWSVT